MTWGISKGATFDDTGDPGLGLWFQPSIVVALQVEGTSEVGHRQLKGLRDETLKLWTSHPPGRATVGIPMKDWD